MKNNLFKKIVLGTEVFSGSWGTKFSSSQVKKILIDGYENGIRELDTAPIYGKKNHEVEKRLGEILKKEKLKYKISTKFSIKKNLFKKKSSLLKDVNNQFEKSLISLKKDYIDNYFFHSGPDKEFFNDEVWELLLKKKEQGLIKNLCLSLKHDLVKKNSLKQLFNFKEYNINKISTVCNLYSNEALKNVIPFCKKNKIQIYGRMPLAKGLLTGKYNSKSRFNSFDPRLKNLLLTKKIIRFSKNIKNLSAKNSIVWSLKHCNKVVLGFKNVKQIYNLNK